MDGRQVTDGQTAGVQLCNQSVNQFISDRKMPIAKQNTEHKETWSLQQ